MDKKNKNPNVPNLRFPYKGDWHKRKLNEICLFFKGNGLSKSDLSNEGFPCILYGELYTTYKNEVISDIVSKTTTTLSNPFLSKNNDLIIPGSGEDPIDIAVARAIYQNDIILGGDLNVLRPKSNVSAAFLSYQLNGVRRYDIAKKAQGKSIVHLHNSDLKEVCVSIPTYDEQLHIVKLLTKIDEMIETQSKIIDTLLSEINSIRSLIFNKSSLKWIPLKDIVAEQDIKLKRGKVIPKHKKNLKYIYPVYSSSITNSGLMGYSDSYMFNQELITWSIDGGGNFFYRKKHKFNITNVSGYMILNENLFNYQFIVQSLIWQHEKLKFDYQTKAHPSVVESLYKIPIMDLEEQHKYACLFSNLNEKYELELHILDLLNMQKKYLLKNMFV